MPKVVARGVLDQPSIELEHLAGAGHDGETGHPVAGEAVANHLDAAGVGGDVAANLAGAGGSEVHRIEEAFVPCEFLQRPGHDASLAADDAGRLR